ncbi:unnamed protein product, partial [marine sediment metagenome]
MKEKMEEEADEKIYNNAKKKPKAKLYKKFPLTSILIYEGITILHFILGGIGIILGYIFSWWGVLFGVIYLVFAFAQIYILMPLTVCPNCVYYQLEDSCCVSGLNKI